MSYNDDCSSDSNDRTVPSTPVPSTPTKNILPELSPDEYDSLPDSGNPAAYDNRHYNGNHDDTTDIDSDSDNIGKLL